MYKVRGKNKKTGEWVYSRSIDDRGMDGVFMRSRGSWVEVDSGTVGRGVCVDSDFRDDIYEGDIMEYPEHPLEKGGCGYVISFDDNLCCFTKSPIRGDRLNPAVPLSTEWLENVERVGTIHG